MNTEMPGTKETQAGNQCSEAEFMNIVHHLDALVRVFENYPSPEVRENALALLQAVDALHRAGLVRLVDFLREHGRSELIDQAAADPVVRNLLLLYDLIPPDARLEVEAILEEARAYLQSHGGDVEILNVEDGIVHLRLQGACQECPASAITLQLTIAAALQAGLPGFQKIELHPAEPSK